MKHGERFVRLEALAIMKTWEFCYCTEWLHNKFSAFSPRQNHFQNFIRGLPADQATALHENTKRKMARGCHKRFFLALIQRNMSLIAPCSHGNGLDSRAGTFVVGSQTQRKHPPDMMEKEAKKHKAASEALNHHIVGEARELSWFLEELKASRAFLRACQALWHCSQR